MPPVTRPPGASLASGAHRAKLTWASHTVARSLSKTGAWVRQRAWIWPILAVLVLSTLAYLLQGAIERTIKTALASELETLRDLEAEMLQTWLESQKKTVDSLANAATTRGVVAEIVAGGDSDDTDQLKEKLEAILSPVMAAHDYDGFFVVDKNKRMLATSGTVMISQDDLERNVGVNEFVTRSLEGKTTVSRPLGSISPIKDHLGRVRTGVPVIYACAPLRDENFQAVGALALRLRADDEFARILRLARLGETGETYAFDRDGLMLSNSRFDDDMILLGILPDEPGSRSIMRLLLRDPGGDMTTGHRPTKRRSELPLTKLVASAVTGTPGVDVEGYRDYRGVKQVGAWRWLPEQQMGIAAEKDYAEAYRPLTIVQRTFWGLFALLTLASIAIYLYSLQVARLRREAQQAAVDAQQIGQYKLLQKLGAGGMGIVYKAQHALLRRPTALKMIEPSKMTPQALESFEREVQVTSQLCHPNTVAIFDYGHTPEGLFYYAMEYLDGIDLQALVDRYGPQPVERVVHILQQVCGSLYEAHTTGLVHRDIKPSNVMLNRRAAEPDVAKVLDFGLVKSVEEAKAGQGGLAGTPLYMSPEAIQTPETVDGRSDLYALGAVGYFLLTGRPVFEADSVMALCQKHLSETPKPPSLVLGRKVPVELEDALLACLEKSRAKRPQTARDLAERLARTPGPAWEIGAAELWWNQHERGLAPTAATQRTLIIDTQRDQQATIAQ
ncbi:MAG: serine/threonine protein kinase [Lacipirellulaceae bacterium]